MRALTQRSFVVEDDIEFHMIICSRGIAKLSRVGKTALRSRIGLYYERAPNVNSVAPLAENEAVPFEALRRVRRRSVSALRKELLDLADGTCPYCGELVVPVTLDHFLPKEAFPEYALLSANLVPICTPCNTAKGEVVVDRSGNRLFSHPYFDAFLTRRVVAATIQWSGDTPYFEMTARRVAGETVRMLVTRHLRAIKRNEKFSIASAKVFRRLKRRRDRSAVFDAATLEDFMLDEIRDHDDEYGKNNWRSIALRAILKDAKARDLLGLQGAL